jgi:hypothetical protein
MAKQPGEEVLQQRRDILRARGVPEAFIEDIATRRDVEKWRTVWAAILYLFPVGGVFLVLLFGSEVILGGIIEWTGVKDGTILFHYEDIYLAPAFLILIWAHLNFSGSAVLLIEGRVRPHPSGHFMASHLREFYGDENKIESVRQLSPENIAGRTEKEFLAHFYRDDIRNFRRGTTLTLVAFVVLYIGGQGNYWRLTNNGIESHRFWARKDYRFDQIQNVSVGCNLTTDERSGVAHYEIHFKNRTIPVDRVLFQSGDKLGFKKVEAFDARLHQMKIPYRQWQGDWIVSPATGKDAELCYRQLGKRLSQNGYERVKALLSLP